MANPIYLLHDFSIWYKNKLHSVRGAKSDYSVELNLEKQCPSLGIAFKDQENFLTKEWEKDIGSDVYESLLNDGVLSLVKLEVEEEVKTVRKYTKETKVIQ